MTVYQALALVVPIFLCIVGQTVAAIWWAARISAAVEFIKGTLVATKQEITDLQERVRTIELRCAQYKYKQGE